MSRFFYFVDLKQRNINGNRNKMPECGHEFEPTDLIRDEIQKEVNSKAEEWKKKKEKELEESLRKNISSDFETKLRLLEENNKEQRRKTKTFPAKRN